MKELGKIGLYLLATVVLGALLAPPLYWAGTWVIGQGYLMFLEGTPFQRYFNRAILVAAIALLWPFAKWLHVRRIGEFTMQSDPLRWRHLGLGFLASLLLMAALGMLLLHLELYRVRDLEPLAKFAKIPVSAAGASIVEELLFRGAILGLLLRSLPRWWALFLTSFLYSIVHFLKPREDVVAPDAVSWLSGFVLVPHAFWQFTEPMLLLAGFTTLLVLGWVLGYAALRTRSLWLPIGLHAGLIVGKFTFSKLTKQRDEMLPWFGSDMQVGLGPLAALALLGLVVWLWLKYESRRHFPRVG